MTAMRIKQAKLRALGGVPIGVGRFGPCLVLDIPTLTGGFGGGVRRNVHTRNGGVAHLFSFTLGMTCVCGKSNERSGKHNIQFLLGPLIDLFSRVLFAGIHRGFNKRLGFFVNNNTLLSGSLRGFCCTVKLPVCRKCKLDRTAPMVSAGNPRQRAFNDDNVLIHPLSLGVYSTSKGRLPTNRGKRVIVQNRGIVTNC